MISMVGFKMTVRELMDIEAREKNMHEDCYLIIGQAN